MRADERIRGDEPIPWGWEVICYEIMTDETIISPSVLAPTLKTARFFNWTRGWLMVSAVRHAREWWALRPRWGQ